MVGLRVLARRGGIPTPPVPRGYRRRTRCAPLSTRTMEAAPSWFPSSTMDLLHSGDNDRSWDRGWSAPPAAPTHTLASTVPLGTEHDFDPSLTASTQSPVQYDFLTWSELSEAVEDSKYYGKLVAVEMDLVEARHARQDFDKILLLVHHGEEEAVVPETESSLVPPDSKLSDRGVGQALSLARRISAFCNRETGLLPELFVLAPLRQALQTAMLALPHYSPFYSHRHIPWLCHAAAATTTAAPPAPALPDAADGAAAAAAGRDLQPVAAAGKADWVRRTDAILDMVRRREERVVVVCTESHWLQTFGCLTQYRDRGAAAGGGGDARRAQQLFRPAELRVVGINFC